MSYHGHPAGPSYMREPPDEQDLADAAWAALDEQWREHYSDLFAVCREILDADFCPICDAHPIEPHKEGALCVRLEEALDGPSAPTPHTAPEASGEALCGERGGGEHQHSWRCTRRRGHAGECDPDARMRAPEASKGSE